MSSRRLGLLLLFQLCQKPHAGGAGVRHSFWRRRATVLVERELNFSSPELRVMHISDAHISLSDADPPRTTRMFKAFKSPVDKASGSRTSASSEFVRLLELACSRQVDLLALGGDIVNFPSNETVAWVLSRLEDVGCGLPFVYTAGNHDWHTEGRAGDLHYDSQRLPQLHSTLAPLFQRSLIPYSRLYGHTRLKGVDVLTFDNSNHQINQEQLDFALEHFGPVGNPKPGPPALLLLHIPLALPGLSLRPKEACGHRSWGAASDENWRLEGRPRWPPSNLGSTQDFLRLVQAHAAPAGRIVALLTGHVHRDFSVPASQDAAGAALACDEQLPGCGALVYALGAAVGSQEGPMLEAEGALQYTTLDAAEGGYRLLTIRHLSRQGTALV